MRKHCRIDEHRVKEGPLKSDSSFQNNGAFILPFRGLELVCVASDGTLAGWEHVSVTVRDPNGPPLKRCPTWEEMCHVKKQFWHDNETVVQFHPDESQYVNLHPFCLHLWKIHGEAFPLPPKDFVG